jgi:nicotinate phosphoribosyltransferase
MGVSADHPYLEIAYKLVSYAGRPTLKLSTDKVSLPGPKQHWRTTKDGKAVGDVLGLEDEQAPAGAAPMLVEVMSGGHRLAEPEPLAQIRERSRAGLEALPAACCVLRAAGRYPVKLSEELLSLQRRATASVGSIRWPGSSTKRGGK